jgi:hypothetical protein
MPDPHRSLPSSQSTRLYKIIAAGHREELGLAPFRSVARVPSASLTGAPKSRSFLVSVEFDRYSRAGSIYSVVYYLFFVEIDLDFVREPCVFVKRNAIKSTRPIGD